MYSADQKFKCLHTVNKMSVGDSRSIRLWVDEVNSFFRRLTFTPDGSFLIAPGTSTCGWSYIYTYNTLLFAPVAGRFENGDKVTNASYVFARHSLTK